MTSGVQSPVTVSAARDAALAKIMGTQIIAIGVGNQGDQTFDEFVLSLASDSTVSRHINSFNDLDGLKNWATGTICHSKMGIFWQRNGKESQCIPVGCSQSGIAFVIHKLNAETWQTFALERVTNSAILYSTL